MHIYNCRQWVQSTNQPLECLMLLKGSFSHFYVKRVSVLCKDDITELIINDRYSSTDELITNVPAGISETLPHNVNLEAE
uniref:Uncharacterized protein n=1 Tax=Nothobranchius korthausae TaxID=1143690 RepID=A0A1A8H0R8_9TELE